MSVRISSWSRFAARGSVDVDREGVTSRELSSAFVHPRRAQGGMDMLNVQIRERNVEISDSLRSHVERKLRFELARFGHRIARVVVRFSDAQSGGSADKRCQIHVGLKSRSARVEDTDADPFVAVDRAALRLVRSVARVLEREREWLALTGGARM
jgi:ribosomal subunit interface protein